MAIQIITYSDPYKLNQEEYWTQLTTYPYFCASQTLVNGMKRLYKSDFQRGNITTVQNLVEALFNEWVGTANLVKQHAVLDNMIYENFPTDLDPQLAENMQRAFRFNREELFESIRTMAELQVRREDILYDKLTEEQKILVDLFGRLLSSDKKHVFEIRKQFSDETINMAIEDALKKSNHGDQVDGVSQDCIVIHGVHQFTPLMLRTIEEVSKYRNVILLFNYQQQYKSAYQTWIDVYSAFDSPMVFSELQQFKPESRFTASFQGNMLADNLGKLINGQLRGVQCDHSGEILEFDNMMEFAGYVSTLFEQAGIKSPDNPLGQMKEQIYAANSSVNKILRVYFPNQFAERHFLDYPLGHFFVSITNLWDPETNSIAFTELDDIKECLGAGILKEDYAGQLLSAFCGIETLFEGCKNLKELQDRLKKVKKNKKRTSDAETTAELSHIVYYNISNNEIDMLYQALDDLGELSSYFYEDFDAQSNSFGRFYRKLKLYLQNEIIEEREINDEFSDLIRRVLSRIEEVENINASASFECLKATMSIYLTQEAKQGGSANWIVRDFEQIDGDILRSLEDFNNKRDVIYHFACLTDEEMNAVDRREFPWPLDGAFFEVAQNPVDWKYQVYVRSKKEYRNFKRYALIYGLEFNRCKYKLSYVKRDEDKERTPYYLLRILGFKSVPNNKHKIPYHGSQENAIDLPGNVTRQMYSQIDFYRFNICPYRFLLETLVENTTIYKDNFLLGKYMEALLENHIRRQLQGFPVSETIVNEKLDETYDDLKKFFPFVQIINRVDSIKTVRNRLLKSKQKQFPAITANELQYMMVREIFIHKQLEDVKSHQKNVLAGKFPNVSEEQISEVFSEQKLEHMKFLPQAGVWCQYCSNRELCVTHCARTE